jgi:hypothetical protein
MLTYAARMLTYAARMQLESGSKQDSAKQQALSNTPKCLGGKTPAAQERALSRPSVPPKSPAALLKAPGAGDKSAAAAAAAAARCVLPAAQLLRCQYLYLCTSKASKLQGPSV